MHPYLILGLQAGLDALASGVKAARKGPGAMTSAPKRPKAQPPVTRLPAPSAGRVRPITGLRPPSAPRLKPPPRKSPSAEMLKLKMEEQRLQRELNALTQPPTPGVAPLPPVPVAPTPQGPPVWMGGKLRINDASQWEAMPRHYMDERYGWHPPLIGRTARRDVEREWKRDQRALGGP